MSRHLQLLAPVALDHIQIELCHQEFSLRHFQGLVRPIFIKIVLIFLRRYCEHLLADYLLGIYELRKVFYLALLYSELSLELLPLTEVLLQAVLVPLHLHRLCVLFLSDALDRAHLILVHLSIDVVFLVVSL